MLILLQNGKGEPLPVTHLHYILRTRTLLAYSIHAAFKPIRTKKMTLLEFIPLALYHNTRDNCKTTMSIK